MRKTPNVRIIMGNIIMIAVHIMIAITTAADMKAVTAINENIRNFFVRIPAALMLSL